MLMCFPSSSLFLEDRIGCNIRLFLNLGLFQWDNIILELKGEQRCGGRAELMWEQG